MHLILRVLNGVGLNRIEGRKNYVGLDIRRLYKSIKCSSLTFIFAKIKTLSMDKLSIFAAVAS